ncbi:hypothetical protein [Photobacterium nomapromontoriensis]|uniref:hypothetical protein n=1 Tax=Photobacterium nomapromontoriensis TaxID=2910237 RepID=UPI003D0C3208
MIRQKVGATLSQTEQTHTLRLGERCIAGLWGVAEATFFFIIPDVYLTYLAQQSYRKALYACGLTLLGALIGGCWLYWLGTDSLTLTEVRILMGKIPAISPDLVASVSQQLSEQGVIAMLFGPLSGTPYKLYALQSASAGVPFITFLLVSIPARLFRFVILVTVTYLLTALVRRYSSINPQCVLIVSWLIFYVLFFLKMPH